MGVISVAPRPGCSLWSQVAKRRASWVYNAIVLADRSGRWVSASCQTAISCHKTSHCYRHSYIIGTVFGEIVYATLPIIYHRRGETAPIRPFIGEARANFSQN